MHDKLQLAAPFYINSRPYRHVQNSIPKSSFPIERYIHTLSYGDWTSEWVTKFGAKRRRWGSSSRKGDSVGNIKHLFNPSVNQISR